MSWFIFYLTGVLVSVYVTTYFLPFEESSSPSKLSYILVTLLLCSTSWLWLAYLTYVAMRMIR